MSVPVSPAASARPSPAGGSAAQAGTARVKRGMAEMLKGGVIMDVVTPEQARIAEGAGAVAVMALGPVGVDLELAGAGDFDGLADVALTPRERLALRRLPSEQRSSAALTAIRSASTRPISILTALGNGCRQMACRRRKYAATPRAD